MDNYLHLKVSIAIAVFFCCSCNNQSQKKHEMGSYGYDVDFLAEKKIEILELSDNKGEAKLLIAPGYQGRVMTSTAAGNGGDSYGWINYKLLEAGEVLPNFNPVGGEERFWLGPEGGPFSLYFKQGAEQDYKNWLVPRLIDTERFDIVSQKQGNISFKKEASLVNASGFKFDMKIERTISILERNKVSSLFGISISESAKMVAYSTDNVLTNTGSESWTKEKGLVSIWLLCMFTPTPTTTVFIPYNTNADGIIVNDDYFGKVPENRLKAENGMIYFKIDGKYRSKIGVPAGRAGTMCGSYDSEKKVLTLLSYTVPAGDVSYVNSKWGPQDESYNGDVINAYNDGPTDDGTIMGPFYEIETSSPGAELAPGESIRHIQNVVHIQAAEKEIDIIVQKLFGLRIAQIEI